MKIKPSLISNDQFSLAANTSEFAGRYAAARPLNFEPLTNKLNHGVFRYPAKFHPPIAHKLVELFSNAGDTILDPFCGSGTLMVEAATLGRSSIGTDVDPLAILVANSKTSLVDLVGIDAAAQKMAGWLEHQRLADESRWGTFDVDIEPEVFAAQVSELAGWIPQLPRIEHWFRRRVTLQLATIRREILTSYHGDGRHFLTLCFASIIRNASNADPVPVSGLEVTSHMLAKELDGRFVNPWQLMARATTKSLAATKIFIQHRVPGVRCVVKEADARTLDAETVGDVDAVITSPPYLTAVDYYRRHTLEMYWLGLTERREQRLDLMARYIGRDRVGLKYLPAESAQAVHVADKWLSRFPGIRIERERAFRHYCDGMARALARMKERVRGNGPIVVVAGDVRFSGVQVSMLELMTDLAGNSLTMRDHLWYPIANRYMSYKRHNEANIAADHVLVFRSKN